MTNAFNKLKGNLHKLLVQTFFLSSCSGCHSEQLSASKSDHFNGSEFFNLSGPNPSGFGGVLKWKLEFNAAQWPKWVENSRNDGASKSVDPGSISLTFINHASFLLQTPHHNILFDPVYSERTSPVQWAGPKRVRSVGLRYEDLPEIHYVLISHNHYDHLDLNFLKKLNADQKNTKFLVPLGDKKFLEGQGITNVAEFDWWDELKVSEELSFVYAEAQHFSGRGLFDRNKSLWGAWAVRQPTGYVYFAGDTGYGPHFTRTVERLGAPALSLLPIGAYAPRWFMKPVHMNPEEAVLAHRDLKSPLSIGIHYGTFQLTDESIDEPVNELNRALEQNPDVDFQLMEFGETRVFRLVCPDLAPCRNG